MGLDKTIDFCDKMIVPTDILRHYGQNILNVPDRDIKELMLYGYLSTELLRISLYFAGGIFLYNKYFQ